MFTEAQETVYRAGLVRFHQGSKVVGAGIYIRDRYVLTCAHVITQCLNLGSKPEAIAADKVANQAIKVDFPFIAREQFQRAEVVPDLWKLNDQDLAILRFLDTIPDGTVPLPFQESTYYREHSYHVYGFPDGHPDGVWAQGKFLGELIKGWIQMEDTKTQGVAIEPGFSGAPVWDEELESIAGMTVARDKDREEAKVGFMIPYQKLKPALEAIALFELLLPEVNNLALHWQNAYRLLRPELSIEPHPSSLQEAILQVQNMTEQGSRYPAIAQFIGYLSLPRLGLNIQPRLFQWLQSQDIDASDLLQEIERKIAEQQTQQTTVVDPHLLFWVQAEQNSDRYSVQAYLVENREHYEPLSAKQLAAPAAFLEQSQDEKVTCTVIEQILRACVEESVAKLPQESGLPRITVHVFLPLTCISWDVDCWPADENTPFTPVSEPIGARYQVVLRANERLNRQLPGYHQMHGKWREKWALLTQLQASPVCERLVCGRNETPQTLFKRLSKRPDVPEMLGFYLVDAPAPFTDETPGLFPVLIGSGAPLAVWLRQDVPDDCQQLFNQLLSSCIAELSSNVQGVRQNAVQECDDGEVHIGHHIGLIVEDPKLVPPTAANAPRLRMSA